MPDETEAATEASANPTIELTALAEPTPTESAMDASSSQATPVEASPTTEIAPATDASVPADVTMLKAETPASDASPDASPEAGPEAGPEAPSVGNIVHVTLDRGANTGACRPAIVVRVWNAEMINAQMFSDGLNDHQDLAGGIQWLTSLRYAKPVAGQPTPPNTWHWRWEE